MMPPVARKGDVGSHGGAILEGWETRRANGQPIACVGHLYGCPIHGPNPIVSGSAIYTIGGRGVARIGDQTACGAVITAGSPTHVSR